MARRTALLALIALALASGAEARRAYPAKPATAAKVAPVPAPAPAPVVAPEPVAAAQPTTYESALAQVRAGDLSADLKALRQQHAARTGSARWDEAKAQFAKVETAPEEALAAARARLDQDWLTPEAHLLCDVALSRLSRKDEGAPHRAFLIAWLRSVTGDRDGLTPATAWNAAAVDEEYFALMLMGRKVEGQSLVNGKDGVFDLIHTVDRKTGQKGDIWFDISSFFGKDLAPPTGR